MLELVRARWIIGCLFSSLMSLRIIPDETAEHRGACDVVAVDIIPIPRSSMPRAQPI
jgi:hypothetical protein